MERKNRKHAEVSKTADIVGAANTPLVSAEEAIAMVKKLADENKFKTITRTLWRNKYGRDKYWIDHFGSWAEFTAYAGLNPTPEAKAKLRQVAKHANADKYRAGSEERLSYSGLYLRPENTKRFKSVLICSDVHDIECDPFARRMFLEAQKGIRPDVVVIDGDLFDFPEFGKHHNDPRYVDPKDRFEAGLGFLRDIREIDPDVQVDLIEGNHEARLLKYFIEECAELQRFLSDVHGMTIRQLLRLDEFEVNYIAKGDLTAFSPKQLETAVLESQKVYYDCLMVRHHPPANLTNSAKSPRPISMAGVHGHHHAHGQTSHYSYQAGSFEWHQLGGMHRRWATYNEAWKAWNCGFMHALIDTKYSRVVFDYTFVGDTMCQLGGAFHERLDEEIHPALRRELEGDPLL